MIAELPEKTGDILKFASESLANGIWKSNINAALDEVAAGERSNKDVLLYSGVSAILDCKLHPLCLGTSQYGKSYLERKIGLSIFAKRFEKIDAASSKSWYYEVLDAKNPKLYDGKIVFLDELADKDEDTLNFIKTITTQGQREATLMTVIDQHARKVPIEGLPVVWSSTFETPKTKSGRDPGNQQYNRFFLIDIDETDEQGRVIDRFQAEEAAYGTRPDETPALIAARHIIEMIMENEKNRRIVVLNPFAQWITTEPGPRNRRPMLETLVKSIAYANRFDRPQFENDKTRLVLATRRDVEEAAKLWQVNEDAQAMKVAPYLRDFHRIFDKPDEEWLSNEEMARRYTAKYGRLLASTVAYQYAHDLSEKNLMTSRKRNNEFGEPTRAYEWTALNSSKSKIFNLELNLATTDLLAKVVEREISSTLVSSEEPRERDIATIVGQLLRG